MGIAKVNILFLLIFAGIGIICWRTTANPTPVPSKTSSTKEPQKNVSSVVNLNNSELVSAHTRLQIEQILEVLGKSDSKVLTQTQMDSSDEAVLVLGETGIGKSSLIQFLIGNPELHSNKAENSHYTISMRKKSQFYVINDDGEKIGSAGNYSFTQFPEIINFNGTNFIDTPGFYGSKSAADEIISMTALKKIINKFKKVKILLLVDTRGVPFFITDNLMNTLKHIDEFIDIDRFLDHIALIFTKVPFAYRTVTMEVGKIKSESNFSADYMVKNYMTNELYKIELKLTDNLKSEKLGEQEKKFYPKVIKFLQSLNVSVNSEENIIRMNPKMNLDVFQHPDKLGLLNNMSFFDSNRESLYQTINDLEPLGIRQQDFKFTLSTEAESLSECMKYVLSED
ncbi:hypothetical protein LSTR_LSTR009980 [Laodelphax striatellus]|uniref:G domain-containing protein n=1 Tax=Laodelphax striatellus TaxID=195883 RepID=A0A482WXV9_LAOST|nr:hypothetical protein LSTR_LSTR009980 [Laodelphax striatellus]